MQQATTKALYQVHAWTGVITGLLLFVVCFTGAVVVFKHEIDLWANPSLRELPQAAQPASLEAVLAALRTAAPDSRLESLQRPGPQMPAYVLFVREADGTRRKLAAHPESGDLLGPVDSELGQFIRSLHVFLLVGPRWIVGFLGVVMLASIVSGVLIHQKLLKSLFTQRWRSSLRLMLSDAHKLIGVWGLLFHLLIALSGAWLGLAPVFVNAAAAFRAPAPAATAPELPPLPATFTPHSIDALHAQAQARLPNVDLRSLRLIDDETPDAQVQFFGPARATGGGFGAVRLRIADGALVDLRDPAQQGVWTRINDWMEPLHFGDFGGLALKWLYFLLGLSPALLSITGTWLWLERQRHEVAPP
jgi:uncharacterized iron-regulated membrane protein